MRRSLKAVVGVVIGGLGLAGCSGQDVLNRLASSAGYALVRDLPYAPDHHLALDVYRPLDGVAAPVVVFFYGGRWSSGARANYRFVGQALAARGILVVIPDYRQYPAVRFPSFVDDGAAAVAWTLTHIAKFGGDPARVFVMGHSAGAHIAALLALDGDYLHRAGAERKQLRGMIGLAGPYDFLPSTDADLQAIFGPPERYPHALPVHFADGHNPPLLLLHGENDTNVKIRNTRHLEAAVTRAGGPVTTVIYPRMGHLRMVASVSSALGWSADVRDQILRFVTRNGTVDSP